MCPFTMRRGVVYVSVSSRYSSSNSQFLSPSTGSGEAASVGGANGGSENKLGDSSRGSAESTPSAPVASRHLCASAKERMSPLARTGTLSCFFISLMKAQLARTSLARFCSRVRPWMAMSCAPAASTILAYLMLVSRSSYTRIFAVTGTGSSSLSLLIRLCTVSQSSIRKAPYRPFLAIRCGQPKLMSTPSQNGATIFAASRSFSGSFAQNCTSSGRSPSHVVKISLRYLGSSTNRRAWIIGVYAHVAPYLRVSMRKASSDWSTMGATWYLGLPIERKKSHDRSLLAGVARSGVGATGVSS
mmetsp:Transcript_30435/g.49065  ORF Transcript_30435/g.49065 Transcript_30435/m.49065 type:complete len:301 (+) Transcript_30435:537-1439(+)